MDWRLFETVEDGVGSAVTVDTRYALIRLERREDGRERRSLDLHRYTRGAVQTDLTDARGAGDESSEPRRVERLLHPDKARMATDTPDSPRIGSVKCPLGLVEGAGRSEDE